MAGQRQRRRCRTATSTLCNSREPRGSPHRSGPVHPDCWRKRRLAGHGGGAEPRIFRRCRAQERRLPTLTTKEGLASDEILSLGSAPRAGSLWVGTPDGLSYLDQGHAVTLTASDGLPDDNIRSLLLARDSTLWIGTGHGLARLPTADPAQAKSIRTYTQADGLGSNVIGSLLEDADGSLWIGTLNGLGHIAHDVIRNYGARDGLTSPIITALAKGSAFLWVGTSGGGIFAFENDEVSAVGVPADYAAGRLPATVYAIVKDDSSHLWLSSTTGIYRVAESDLTAVARGQRNAGQISIDHFDVADGLRLQDCASGGHPEAALGADGLLWFGTQKGASVVDTMTPCIARRRQST